MEYVTPVLEMLTFETEDVISTSEPLASVVPTLEDDVF